MADIFGNIRNAESSGNNFARNPKSSAFGPDQFLSSTWLSTIKKHRPDLAAGKSDAELLAMRSDAKLSGALTKAYAGDNASYLRSRGLNPEGNTYLTHFAGPAGASALLSNPGGSAEQLLGPRVIAANPFLRGMTGADVVNWARAKETGQPTSAASAMTSGIRSRIGTSTEGGQVAAPASSGDRLKAALTKSYDQDKIDTGKTLQQRGQQIASSYGNTTGLYGGTALAAIGGLLEGSEAAAKKEHDAEFIRAATNAADPTALMGVLLSSSDPKMREAGLELKAKLLTPKTTEWVPTADGRAVVNKATGEVRSTGIEKEVAPSEIEKRAKAAGLKPGTPEYNDYVLRGPEKQASRGNPITNEAGLRKEFDDLSKDFRIQLAGADRVRIGASSDTAQGDMALVYGFMKMLDPGSVVREGEFATAENTGGVPDRVRIMYNKALNGERLTPEMRSDFVKQAEAQMAGVTERQNALTERYTGIAKRHEFDPANVVTQYAPTAGLPKPDPDQPRAVQTTRVDPATGLETPAQASGAAPAIQTPQPATPASTPPGDPLAQAADAIKRGAPAEGVIKRLQQMGIDASSLMPKAQGRTDEFFGQGLY